MKTIAKSLVAGLGAAVTAAIPYSSDGINLQEALIIFGAFLATQQATYWTNDGAVRTAAPLVGKKRKVWGWGG